MNPRFIVVTSVYFFLFSLKTGAVSFPSLPDFRCVVFQAESYEIESFPSGSSNPVPSLETLSGCREESSDAVENSKPLDTPSNIPINAKAQRGEAGTHVTAAQGNAKVDRDEYGCTLKPKLTDKECQGVIPGESVEGTGGKRTKSGRIVHKPVRYRSVNFIGMVRKHNQHAKTQVKRNGTEGDWAQAEADEIRKFQDMDVYEEVRIPEKAKLIPKIYITSRVK
ncbi:hypothetical protein OXX69_009318 [Metschnikowia pulcherrima]